MGAKSIIVGDFTTPEHFHLSQYSADGYAEFALVAWPLIREYSFWAVGCCFPSHF